LQAPAVSIVVPTYNRAGFLPAAIDSVRAQSFADWELIVVDDGSTDGTVENFASLSRGDPRIRLVQNRGARGPAGARNAGLAQCRALWVAFLDSDDLWQPEKLDRFMAAAAANPEAVLIGSNYWIVDQAAGTRQTMLEFIARTMMPWWKAEAAVAAIVPCNLIESRPAILAQRDVMISTAIAEFLWVHTSSAMVRLDAARKLGGFNETLSQTEDIELWLDLAEIGPVVFIPEALATYETAGRDEALGERYAHHEPARKPTLYSTRLLHLDLMERMGRRRLTPAQRLVLADRIVHGHRSCAKAARHVIPFHRRLVHWFGGSESPRLRAIGDRVWPPRARSDRIA
jgi:GT2 family glycosyltransferase